MLNNYPRVEVLLQPQKVLSCAKLIINTLMLIAISSSRNFEFKTAILCPN